MYDKCNELCRLHFAFALQLRVKLYFTVLCPLQRNVLFIIYNLSIYSTINLRSLGERPNTAKEESFWRETSPIRIFHPD